MLLTRRIDWTVGLDKSGEFLDRYRELTTELLAESDGFVNHMILAEGTRLMTLTFWRNQNAAQLFAERGFARLHNKLKPYLSGQPEVHQMMLLDGAVPTPAEIVEGGEAEETTVEATVGA